MKHLVKHKLASDYNENILSNSTVNEIKQSFFNICSRKYEIPSKTILYIENAKITHFGEGSTGVKLFEGKTVINIFVSLIGNIEIVCSLYLF